MLKILVVPSRADLSILAECSFTTCPCHAEPIAIGGKSTVQKFGCKRLLAVSDGRRRWQLFHRPSLLCKIGKVTARGSHRGHHALDPSFWQCGDGLGRSRFLTRTHFVTHHFERYFASGRCKDGP